ncbi:hypothetical protein scyTo_0000935 [Scyliorhinus torazame]|uniref:Uncharacterized protein n=1 Tax=Scyliorhinus torazame TaxID=75743 RepID=A0A401P6P3_SCYTO|nr:hypothetical protein [Scyliorhinus torazame]
MEDNSRVWKQGDIKCVNLTQGCVRGDVEAKVAEIKQFEMGKDGRKSRKHGMMCLQLVRNVSASRRGGEDGVCPRLRPARGTLLRSAGGRQEVKDNRGPYARKGREESRQEQNPHKRQQQALLYHLHTGPCHSAPHTHPKKAPVGSLTPGICTSNRWQLQDLPFRRPSTGQSVARG